MEQGVLEVLAQIAQLSARTKLSALEAARLALHLMRDVLQSDSAVLLTGAPPKLGQVDLVIPGTTESCLFPHDDPNSAVWAAHAFHTLTFVNETTWQADGHVFRGALAVLPLLLTDGPPVSLVVARQTQAGSRWSVHDRQLLQAAARAVRLAAERQQHLLALEYSANHDALTGCLNRHAFTQATSRLDQGRPEYSLALMDLDGFKALNDREGHARGDEALRVFARTLRTAFPLPDELYRLGGDEFALLLCGTSDEDHDAILHAVGLIPEQLHRAGLNIAGVSVGIAHAHEAAGSDAVLALADRRMYLMKNRRRQPTVIPERPASSPVDPGPVQGTSASPRGRTTTSLNPALLLLGAVLEARDAETHNHSLRVVRWATTLGQHLGLPAGQLEALQQGAYLHDLGKLVVPDRVLLKPGRLDPEEWVLMRAHAEEGHRLASRLQFLDPRALDVVRSHHERWDGRGYPDRLAGEDIPLLARIYAVVDVFDALTNHRPYKEAWSINQALTELQAQAGRQFDPAIVAAFLKIWAGHRFPSSHANDRNSTSGAWAKQIHSTGGQESLR